MNNMNQNMRDEAINHFNLSYCSCYLLIDDLYFRPAEHFNAIAHNLYKNIWNENKYAKIVRFVTFIKNNCRKFMQG